MTRSCAAFYAGFMNDTNHRYQLIPLAGLAATMGVAVYMVVRLSAQDAGGLTGDFSSAAIAEVRDAQGQVILRGQFALVEEEDDDTERKAPLAPAGSDTDASGEAEVEFSKAAPAGQEIEFSVHDVDAGATYTFLIDGTVVGAATADGRGRAALEIDIKP